MYPRFTGIMMVGACLHKKQKRIKDTCNVHVQMVYGGFVTCRGREVFSV